MRQVDVNYQNYNYQKVQVILPSLTESWFATVFLLTVGGERLGLLLQAVLLGSFLAEHLLAVSFPNTSAQVVFAGFTGPTLECSFAGSSLEFVLRRQHLQPRYRLLRKKGGGAGLDV